MSQIYLHPCKKNRIALLQRGLFFILLCLLSQGCTTKQASSSPDLVSIQTLDRNGFSETISNKERLATYEKTDFFTPQPYHRVVRVFGKASQGTTSSKIMTYHPNGLPWQYLETENGRAHGKYQEWHMNGALKIEAQVIEGTPDMSEMAQMTWLFDGQSFVYDEESHLIASIPYEKGMQEGKASYFYASGQVSQEIPYHQDAIDGKVKVFDPTSQLIEQISYKKGLKDGLAFAYWSPDRLKYQESYRLGKLIQAQYYDNQGFLVAEIREGKGKQAIFDKGHIASLIEYVSGIPEGEVQHFNADGVLTSLFHIKEGKKDGEEWEYYSSSDHQYRPKLYLQWHDDTIEGQVKTWYETGVLESQREMHNNQKHGLSLAWFKEGDLMLMEEYEQGKLEQGTYFRKWEKHPISRVENGTGTATLFDSEGRLIKKIVYEKGSPQLEPTP